MEVQTAQIVKNPLAMQKKTSMKSMCDSKFRGEVLERVAGSDCQPQTLILQRNFRSGGTMEVQMEVQMEVRNADA